MPRRNFCRTEAFGAFITGAAVGESTHLRERTSEHIKEIVTNVFAPFFFVSIGLRTSRADSRTQVFLAAGGGMKIFRGTGKEAAAEFRKILDRDREAGLQELQQLQERVDVQLVFVLQRVHDLVSYSVSPSYFATMGTRILRGRAAELAGPAGSMTD